VGIVRLKKREMQKVDIIESRFLKSRADFFEGFRVVAMSVVPVDKTTIIYGSHDGGQTVFASNPKFNALMKMVCNNINANTN